MKTNILALISHQYGNDLTKAEKDQLVEFISIYKQNDFGQLWRVNEFITNSNSWGDFPDIRSLNNYNGIKKFIPGIQPRYFAIISKILQHVQSPKTYIEEIVHY